MVAKGEVALTDAISKYLPQGVTAPSLAGREITLLDLVTHHPSPLDLRVFGENGQLKVHPANQNISRLLPVGNHQFVLDADKRIRLVFTVVGDRAESVTLHQAGGAYPGKRKP